MYRELIYLWEFQGIIVSPRLIAIEIVSSMVEIARQPSMAIEVASFTDEIKATRHYLSVPC